MRVIGSIGVSVIVFVVLVHCRPQDNNVMVSTTTIEGITVGFRYGNIVCDSVICPPGTAACRVTRRRNPFDELNFRLIRRCFNSDGITTILDDRSEMIGEFNKSISFTYVPGENPILYSKFIFSDPVDADF